MGADLDPAIFVIDLRDANKKLNKKKSFSAYYFFEGTVRLHHFSKIRNKKEVIKPGFRIRIDLMRIRIRIRIQHFF
jgi:hypothetical protein